MDAQQAITRLENYQGQIAAILADVRPLLSNADASQFKAMALGRWQLLRVLRAYQLFKHTEIFDPIIAGAAGAKADSASLLKERCIAIAEVFGQHVQRWSLEGPSNAWPKYSAEALALSEQIEAHLVQEQRDVRALLVGMQRTRQPLASSGPPSTEVRAFNARNAL